MNINENKKIDTEKIAYHIKEILLALGDDPEREGLKETPQRVAKMYAEVFEGMNYTNEEIARMFDTTFEDEDYLGEQQSDKPNNMVAVTEIPIFSYCEHHMALMYNMTVSVAYLPKEKIIGLSKIARIADMVGRRLQLQERIGSDIAEIVAMITESEDVAVLIKGEHSCMTARGIKKSGTVTRTATFRGVFENDSVLRQEALLLLG
ncbi:MAG: GTP cyclohydrolase I FolE [Peptococcaceae bacterium]|nr:GTP cyclohydrolase I FolE [Peptococcaceae bacterium]